MSVRAHRTTGAQTTEPKHRNGESVNDVRVSSKKTNCHVRHDDPGPEPAGLLRRHAEQHEVGVVTVETDGHRAPRGCPADLLLRVPWIHFVSEEVYQEVSPREPGGERLCMCPKI